MAEQIPIVFFGSDNFSLPALEVLHSIGWEIKAVVTKPDSPAGRGRKVAAPPAKTWADQNGIPALQPAKLAEVADELSQFGVQIGVVASYGKLIPDSILELFTLGLVNIHPSLLPKYRGPSPIEAAILNGDSETGVTLMKVSSRMDAGPIYAQSRFALTGTETQSQLYDQLGKLGAEMLAAHLPAIAAGQLNPEPQDESNVTVTELIQKADGQIDWSQPAGQIERQIRAYLTWPGSRTNLFGKDVTVTAAHIEADGEICPPGKCLHLSTGQACLIIDRLKPAGGRDMTAAEFLAGIR